MKEISLKKPAEKNKGTMAIESPAKDSYPSFSIYDNAPEELMKIPVGKELIAKVIKNSEDIHKGDKTRNSCGFEVISVMINDSDEKIDKARVKGKEIGDRIKKEGIS